MNKVIRKRIICSCVVALVLYVVVAIGVHIAWRVNCSNLNERKEGLEDGLPRAVSLAQESYDSKYGKDAFLYGLRRIVRDGDKLYYGFFVAKNVSDAEANMLVEVDLTCRPAKTILRNK